MLNKRKSQAANTPCCLYIDADSFPACARDLIIRMAKKKHWQCRFAANRPLPIKEEDDVHMVIVPAGKDMADHYIYSSAGRYDIVLTRDILLAEVLVNDEISVINHLGEIFDQNNIAERRSLRDFSFHAHQCGLVGSPGTKSNYGKKELARLSNSLDRMMNILMRRKNQQETQGE